MAFAILAAAASLGALLAIPFLRGKAARRVPWPVALAHGGLGVTGFAVLVAALRHGLPASGMGTGGFGPAAASFLGVALVLGLVIGLSPSWRRRRPAGALVAVHASLAIGGVVMLWALASLG